MAAMTPAPREEVTVLRRALRNRVDEVLDSGITAGLIALEDSRMPGLALLSLGIDVTRWYHDDGEWTPEDIGRGYAELIGNPIKMPADA